MGKDAPEMPQMPAAPDPAKVAAAQSEANIRTAQEQARLAMTGQVTPFGSIQYVQDPTSPSGFRAITQLTPEQQALLAQGQDLQAQYGGVAGEQLGRVGDTMATPFDLSAGRAREISDIQQTFLDEDWNQRQQALEADMLNRGIRPGSEAYETQMRQFGDQRSSAYDRMFLDAWQLANNAALTERNIPLTDLAALGVGGQPGGVQPVGGAATPSPGVAATDVAGPVYQSYQGQMNAYGQQLNAYNQQMGGLFGLGASALGGWAQAGFPGVAALGLSDRRAKKDVRRIGEDPRGWGVYLFRYLWEGAAECLRLGFMADEIERVRPDAVEVDRASGFKMVNYGALASA